MVLKNARVLVVDDDLDVLIAMRLLLKPEVKDVVVEKNPENLRWTLTQNHFDLLLLDMNYISTINTGNEGLFWLKKVKSISPETLVIMITAYGDIDLAVRSLKEGATDFVVKPWHNEKLVATCKDALRNQASGVRGQDETLTAQSSKIVAQSLIMENIFLKIRKIAPTDANILILGENGTGKELVAESFHQHSLRHNKPFVKVDVGSLTETLFESELFGHKKGAFTDAREDRKGRFE